jgi:hypothetical protein
MSTENEVQVIEQSQDTALYLITKAEIDTQISTAKAFPRSIKSFMDNAITLATINEEIAQSCTYSVPRAGKFIEGASVRLAEIIASSYGNIRVGARVIDNDGKIITSQGICHDLETNFCATIEVKARITNKMGQTYSEDMQITTANSASSKALRNAIFRVVPTALVQSIHDQVKLVAKGSAVTLTERRSKALAWFNDQGVKDSQICEILNIKGIEDIDLEKLATLSGMRSAVKNGESTIKEMFSLEKEAIKELPLLSVQELQDAIHAVAFEGVDVEGFKLNYNLTTDQLAQLENALPK